ncbi:MAG TPA: asparagine synthase (glutamine-hydrolyzing) [Acidimicrobiales bacterium]|nr:asparagine synthase (glutamine-hydrolyzing) [Acidimicrobiales bacterium]
MCGIAGAYQQVDGEPTVRAMSARLAHRGPDDAGMYAFADDRVTVNLAHRRLSIIDLAHGHQPFVKEHLALSYNGELYNYKEMRADLTSRGATFRTSSDTEVVLEAWRQWGPACLRRFRGMFAFALFDEVTGSLFLVRDQLGIKPLHFLARKDGVVFASELKAIATAFGSELRIEPSALVASALYYWVPDQRCALRGVEKLQPGTWIEFHPDGTRRGHRYWDAAEVAAAAAAGPPVDLGEVIESSVAAHLVSDVPVSSFLSGGLDSSIITTLAKRHSPRLEAFTIAFRSEDRKLEAMPDDARYARSLAARTGVTLHEIEIEPDVVGLLPRMVDILDEPVGDPAAINTLLMCEAAREAGVKVILSGMGADELFGGYRKHRACLMAARYQRLPRPARRAVRGAVRRLPVVVGGRGLRHARWAKRFVTFSELSEEAAFRRSYTLYDPGELLGLLSPDLAEAVDDVLGEHVEVYCDNDLSDHVSRMCLADARLFLTGLNLAYTDRASMAASTEVRVPFVDPVVFRAAFSLPASEKVHRGRSKVALRNAARAWLPPDIIRRPKASFSAPLRAWVDHDLREVVADVLVGGTLVETGFLRADALAELIAAERAGREDRSKQIWQLLTLELWYRHARAAGLGL